jgi:hypothetical protein
MSFDLNINNYTKEELMEMFELPANYDRNIFEIKETKMRDNILQNTDMREDVLNNTLQFIIQAKNILLNEGPHPGGGASEFLKKVYNANYQMKAVELEASSEHMVQARANVPYLSSYPSQFFPGVINPLKKKTRYMNLNVDSKFRDNYYSTSSSNFNVPLNQSINNMLTMQLDAIELPITFYTISKQFDNNYFYIELPDTNESQLVEIPEGNYDYTGLENIINKQLSILPGAYYPNIVFKINITNDTNGTGQMLVGLDPSATPFNFGLDFQKDRSGINNQSTSLALKLGWMLGFRNGRYIGNLNYVSEGVVDILGARYLYLVIDDHNTSVNNSFYSSFTNSLLNKNILARISVQGGSFKTFSQTNLNITTNAREYFGPVNLQAFTVQLLDSYGRLVDLNNMDFSFCLTLQLVYDI